MIMPVTAYLDSSGQTADPFVTLAAFAANSGTWAAFNAGWNDILASGFRPVPYMHMKEAVHRGYGTPFDHNLGWTRTQVWELVFKLAQYMGNFNNGELTMHSCEVNMDAWREVNNGGPPLPSEVALCNRYVPEYLVGMFAQAILNTTSAETIFLRPNDSIKFVFDRNERFFLPFSAAVELRKSESERLGGRSMWHLVGAIDQGESKTCPGLQAADVLAWGVNRQNTALEGREGKYLAHILKQIVRCTWKEFDLDSLRREQVRMQDGCG